MDDERILIGLVEQVKIIGEGGEKLIAARIDTGAARTSVDVHLAKELDLGPIVGTKKLKNAMGDSTRVVVRGTIELRGKQIETEINITDRSHMTYPVLIGRDILKQGFLIDPNLDDN